MDTSTRQPCLIETVNAMTDIQLHRYNTETLVLMKVSVAKCTEELSTPERLIRPYFIHLTFEDMAPERKRFLNQIPTSFSLSDEQIDALIAAGGELLRSHR